MANSILAKMAVLISANTAEFSKGTKSAETSLKNFESSVKSVGASIGLAFGVREIGNFLLEANKIAGVFEGVKRAFDRLPQSTKLMDTLQQSTHGTVSELQLMQQALRARNFGINVKDLATYLEFAAIRAQQTGESIDYMVNSIVLGLGRGSIKILDNLQVNISEIKKTVKETGVSLQEAFRQQVLEQMKTIGGYAETSATAVDKLKVAFERLKLTVSKEVSGGAGLGATLIDTLNEDLQALVLTAKSMGGVTDFLDNIKLIQRTRELNKQALKESNAIEEKENGTIQEKIDFIQQEINTRQELIGKYNDQISATNKLIPILEKANSARNKNKFLALTDSESAALKSVPKEYAKDIGLALENTRKQNSALTANLGVTQITQKLLKERLKVLTDEQNGLGDVGNKLGLIQQVLQDIENEEAFKNAALDEASIAGSNKELIRLNKELERLQKLGEKKFDNSVFKFTPPSDVDTKDMFLLSPLEEWSNAVVDYARVTAASVNDITGEVTQDILNMFEAIPETLEKVKKETLDISGIIAGGIADIADAAGSALTGSENFGKAFLRAMGRFAQQFGGLLIAAGVGKVALESFSGPAMIAAGAALVAIGGAISQVIANRPGGSGSSGSRSGGNYTRFDANAAYQNMTLQTSVSGTDLNIVLANTGRKDSYTVPQWR